MGVVFIRADMQAVDDFTEAVAHLQVEQSEAHPQSLHLRGQAEGAGGARNAERVRRCAARGPGAAIGRSRRAPRSSTNGTAPRTSASEKCRRVCSARYEDRGERILLGRTRQFENELVDAEARAVEPWSKILDELDLQP